MAIVHKFRVSSTRSNDLVCRSMAEAEAKGTMMRRAGRCNGRWVELDGRMLRNFGTCSYLGFDQRSELKDGSIAATQNYGTQFSISRAYLECALYQELEQNLEKMTGRPTLVAPSTTLAHMAALPVLVRDDDAVLIDQFAHASLHAATELLRDVPVHLVRHGGLDQIEQLIEKMSPDHDRIWFVADGLYSMSGDFAPFEALGALLNRWPRLHLYIDDAHATGWMGMHGRGAALTHIGQHPRLVVALSLNKAFAAAGCALALPDVDTKIRIRRCGGPMLFSGPIQPPMLGAAVASSRLHLSAQHPAAQDELIYRIDYVVAAAKRTGLPLAAQHRAPIFFIPCDSVDDMTDEVRRLLHFGFYVCPSAFPAVPVNRPGIRFTITLHNPLEDIDALIKAAVAEKTEDRVASQNPVFATTAIQERKTPSLMVQPNSICMRNGARPNIV
jgi:7-keto-8-aminopelargonate synthetase-like enzyme